MKLSKEDIGKYATDDEKKQLVERRVEAKRRKRGARIGRPTHGSKFLEYKNWLKIDIENIETNFVWENWDDLEAELVYKSSTIMG